MIPGAGTSDWGKVQTTNSALQAKFPCGKPGRRGSPTSWLILETSCRKTFDESAAKRIFRVGVRFFGVGQTGEETVAKL
jgi:hypothetical protein